MEDLIVPTNQRRRNQFSLRSKILDLYAEYVEGGIWKTRQIGVANRAEHI